MIEKKNEIKISVLLAVYNCALYLKECIDSILSQTFQQFEFIIINDGSTDSSEEIILQYKDSHIIYIKNEINRGLIESLNLGLSICRGKYIARMDADDIAFFNRLQVQYDYMEAHPGIGICGSSVEAFFEKENRRQPVDFADFASDDLKIRAFTFFQSPFCHPSVIMRKEILDHYNLKYPDTYYRAEDYGLWVELLRYTKGANTQEVLLHYRKHKGSETAMADKQIEDKIKVIILIQEKYLAQNGILLKPEQMRTYTCFTDRSFPYNLTSNNQKAAAKVLKDFLSQFSHKQRLKSETIHQLSIICFYKFFINRKIPYPFFLQKLWLKGGVFYFKKWLYNKI